MISLTVRLGCLWFIWKGKDKVKPSALIHDIEDGGLKMLDLESMISAQRVMLRKKIR